MEKDQRMIEYEQKSKQKQIMAIRIEFLYLPRNVMKKQ